ncbi:MAG: DUF1189 domain-containing protein [Elusimicrobiota bacterium]|jgi:hypothetical protein|nr:DUF1189 domain-containing protein [Elusimicrobiota bacterium]
MFLAPLRALYSAKFYNEYIKKSGWAAAGFIVYLFFITAVLLAPAGLKAFGPQVGNFIDKTAQYMPAISVENGKITVNGDNPLTIAPPELKGYKIYFDTSQTDPVYPTQMEQAQIMMQITADKLYISDSTTNRFQYIEVPDDKIKLSVDAQTIRQNKPLIQKYVVWVLICAVILSQIIRIPFMILLGFIVASVFNGMTMAGLSAGRLFKAACYMQAPITVLYLLNFVSPLKVPGMIFVYLLATGAYSFLFMRRYAAGESAARGNADDTAHKK